MKKFILFFLLLLLSVCAYAQIITTIAGGGTGGLGDNGPATAAQLDGPIGVALDGKGNIYIADTYNNRIRKINPAGIITTISGNDTSTYNGDGMPATAAHLSLPVGIICDSIGSIYFADAFHNRVRKIDTFGIITTIAGNGIAGYNGDNISSTAAEINNPWFVAIDALGNLYISEARRIRRINTLGIITTVAGTGTAGNTGDNGPATDAEISTPYGIAIDHLGNIYFSDYDENVVRKIDISGTITAFAGGGSLGDNGLATLAKLSTPTGITVDALNNIYIADSRNYRIRKVTAVTGTITTITGDGILGFGGDNGPATNAKVSQPTTVTIDATGGLYISDFGNNRIRYINNPMDINSINAFNMNVAVYPNPNDGQFTVNIPATTTQHVQIIITNALGRKVKEISAVTGEHTTIQLDDQQPGIYYLLVVSSGYITSNVISVVK